MKSRDPDERETIGERVGPAKISILTRPWTLATIFAFLALCSSSLAENWEATVSKDPPGNFPELRPLRASYRFGWSGFTAATGDVHFTRPSEDKFQLDGTGRTIGLVRALWKLDVNYQAVASAGTLRPIKTKQIESYRSKKIVTHLTFTNNGVTRLRTEGKGAAEPKIRHFNFPNLFDLFSAMLYLRSQPLKDRSVYRVVAYPATNAYLAIVTVIGREKISVHAGNYSAIKLDLQLKRIGKQRQLEQHRKFRRGTIWVSDDAERLLLRIEAQVFVGTVFAELQSVRFDNPQ
ncbi:MAG TPA: DUF3108 domain-containing protein [Candidatus Udaeobacter sp.]|nr:DUF3108 domain-containing protein [Candidatus Udaeobacter sp.]